MMKLQLRQKERDPPEDICGNGSYGIKTVKAAVLLDDGSSDTFCTLNLAQKLPLPTTSHQRLRFSHFGSEDERQRCNIISPITLKTNEGH